jgi:hypothetical protein
VPTTTLHDLGIRGSIADRYLPQYQFAERHEGIVHAPLERILEAIEMLDDKDDALVRLFLIAREAPARLWGFIGFQTELNDRARFGLSSFTKLERTDSELVYGLCGRFWRPSFGLVKIANAETFKTFCEPGIVKLTMHFIATPGDNGGFVLTTETRVFCPDNRTRIIFTPYWWAIRGVSGFIRRRILAIVRRKAEAALSATLQPTTRVPHPPLSSPATGSAQRAAPMTGSSG